MHKSIRSTRRHFAMVYHGKKAENATGQGGKRALFKRMELMDAARARDARALPTADTGFVVDLLPPTADTEESNYYGNYVREYPVFEGSPFVYKRDLPTVRSPLD